jgi:YidC/Oxa1 family membrane protein insertase
MFSTIGYWICIPFAAILRLFYNLTGSYGMSLILFTLVIKLILLPFQMKSKKSMIRMGRMSGKMQEIQKKYANNQLKMQEEMQRFYQEEGINPMSGCLWSFLPMPILLALYYIIREPIVYFMNFGGREAGREVLEAARTLIQNAGITLSSNTVYEQIEISNIINSKFPEFAAEHAGWVNVDYHFLGIDLTAMPTSAFSALKEGFSLALIGLILIPIISGALSLLLSKISMNQSGTQNTAGGAQMKMMMWMMPLMSVYIGFILPAALGVYWIAQSAFSIIQELILGKFYNEKLQAEEDAREEARQADRQKRMEEAKILQEQQRQQAAQKQSLRDKRKAAEAAKAAKAKKAAFSTTEAGRVGDRPYARGRSFKEDRYDDNETK